jgi:hypothetical protein
MPNSFKTLEDLKDQGFVGFIKISDLMRDSSKIPDKPGVYMVLYTGSSTPTFIDPGTGGFHKGLNPNVSFSVLIKNWVKETVVIYIGKAGGSDYHTTLSKRLKDYLRFGKGATVGHYGGRLIWQIKNSGDLLICWKTMISGEPRNVEAELIGEFVARYDKRPFANLAD